jgi:hypothetical protein
MTNQAEIDSWSFFEKSLFFLHFLFSPFQKFPEWGPVRRKSRFLAQKQRRRIVPAPICHSLQQWKIQCAFHNNVHWRLCRRGRQGYGYLVRAGGGSQVVYLREKRNLFFAMHIGQEIFGLSVDWQIEKDIKLVCFRNITASQDTRSQYQIHGKHWMKSTCCEK